MATFSQQFLANLGRPQMAESLFGLGRAIGGIPGQIQQQKKQQEELARYNKLMQTTEQGTSAALEGDVEGLKNRINELIKLRDAATSTEEKDRYQQAIINLQRQIPGAQKIEVGNKAKELVNIEQMLKDPSLLAPKKAVLQQRLEVLQKDPEAMRQYQQYQLDTFRYEQAEKEMRAGQWMDSNRAAMLEAIEAGDTDKLTSIIEGAGDFIGAAQKFANAAVQSAENMAKFEENSMEQKTGPSVDYYAEQVNNLPEEVSKNLKVILEAYTRVSEEGWDGKQWNAGARTRAKRLEKELQSQLKMLTNQLAVSEYNRAINEERRKQEEIKKLKLQIGLPMSSEYLEEARRQVSSMSDREDITEDKIRQQAEYLYNLDQKRLIEQLAALTGEEPTEEEDSFVMVNNIKTTPGMVKEAIAQQGEEAIIKKLRDNGVSETDIAFLVGKKLEEKPRELSKIEKRVEKQKQRFSEALGTREERMQALGPREQRMTSLFQ